MIQSILLAATVLATPPTTDCTARTPLTQKSTPLQQAFVAGLYRAGLMDEVNEQKLAALLVDLTQADNPAVAGVNEDRMLYGASLPKIGILLGFVDAVDQGRVAWTWQTPYRLERMMTVSSNRYASWAFDRAGMQGIADTLRHSAYCLYQAPHGGLWLGRGFRRRQKVRRDPLFNITHGATARQVGRFYLMLDRGQLVSPYWSARMVSLSGPPGLAHKFVGAIGDRPGVRFVARKSGSWRSFHADSALIQHHHHRYILVGLADTWTGGTAMAELARLADDLITDGAHRRAAGRWQRGGL